MTKEAFLFEEDDSYSFAPSLSISLISMHYQNFAPTFGFAFGAALVLGASFLYNRRNPPEAKSVLVEKEPPVRV